MAAPQPRLAASTVVVDASCLLLVQRAEGGARWWALPGGKVEPGERVRAAAERELREETGLRGRAEAFVGWVERRGQDAHYVILAFHVELLDPPGAAVAGDDAAAVAWIPLTDVVDHDLVSGLADFLVDHGVVPPRR